VSVFKLGINMPGAISAGAYTAGVLDFLTEALDAWYEAKAQGAYVPMHDVSIEVFTGASAGGMCAAISAILLQDDFEHISDTSKTGTSNRFYESWVNMIDMQELLKSDDLVKSSNPVISLLGSTILDTIASFALKRGKPLPKPRQYCLAKPNTIPILDELAGGSIFLECCSPASVEQTTFFYGDRIRFEIKSTNTVKQTATSAHLLDLTSPEASPEWEVLRTSAMATGAFPVFRRATNWIKRSAGLMYCCGGYRSWNECRDAPSSL
jgi:hypothetical protein